MSKPNHEDVQKRLSEPLKTHKEYEVKICKLEKKIRWSLWLFLPGMFFFGLGALFFAKTMYIISIVFTMLTLVTLIISARLIHCLLDKHANLLNEYRAKQTGSHKSPEDWDEAVITEAHLGK